MGSWTSASRTACTALTVHNEQDQRREPNQIHDRQGNPCRACSGGQASQDKQHCPASNSLYQAGNRHKTSHQGTRRLGRPAVLHR
jgi:hypothetical protein